MEYLPLSDSLPQPTKLPIGEYGAVDLTVDNEAGLNSDDLSKMKEIVSLMVCNAYRYFFSIVGADFSYITRSLAVVLKKSAGHMHQGSLMYLSAPVLSQLLEDSENKFENILLQQSLVIHELLHNLSDEESFSMFVELIYMVENQQTKRCDDLMLMIQEEKLPKSYLSGINTIADWLGFETGIGMLASISKIDITTLKEVFKFRLNEYCENEFQAA